MGDIKSLRSNYRVKATFKNGSERTVDLYWVDFHGGLVLYSKEMGPGKEMRLQTFVTHPWVARDSVTGQRLWLSGQPVYVTALPAGSQVDQNVNNAVPIDVGSADIVIHIPVFRLEEICIGFFRKHLGPDRLTGLELNKYLLEKLSTIPRPSARIYRPQQGIITDD